MNDCPKLSYTTGTRNIISQKKYILPRARVMNQATNRRFFPTTSVCYFMLLHSLATVSSSFRPSLSRSIFSPKIWQTARGRRKMMSSGSSEFPSQTDRPLSHELAETLIRNLLPGSPILLADLAIAGGGSRTISALASTPNASRLLLEGNVLYSRKSFAHFVVGEKIPVGEEFSFTNPTSCSMLSSSALKRALSLTEWKDMGKCVGLGCTSSLRSENDREGRVHRLYVLLKDISGNEMGYHGKLIGGTRDDQEELVSCVSLITLMEYAQGKIKEQEEFKKLLLNAKEAIKDKVTLTPVNNSKGNTVEGGLERLFSDEAQAVLLIPSVNGMVAVEPSILPKDCIIFPGSFNPIHVGHISLAEASMTVIQNMRSSEFSERDTDTVMKYVEKSDRSSSKPQLIFELSVTNADKPPLLMEEVQRRLDIILNNMKDKDYDWGVVLTSAPLFVEKVDMLGKYMVSHSDASEHERKMTFVIGTDTMVRLLNPKYYDNNEDKMMTDLRKIKEKGIRFIVGGRLEQIKGDGGGTIFVSGQEYLQELPTDLQHLFILLSENDFRVDISSTELRKQVI